MQPPRTIGIVYKKSDSGAIAAVRELAERFGGGAITFLCEGAQEAGIVSTCSNVQSLPAKMPPLDLMVVLGGDGTFIHAAGLVDDRAVPLLGVNLGSLGFLTEFTREEFFAHFARVLSGDFECEERLRLQCLLTRAGTQILARNVINDVVVSKGALARIATVRIAVDGRSVTKMRGDGLIVATPTGSTAYNLATGGPIVAPDVDGMILAPICPHSLNQRPLVITAAAQVELELFSANGKVFLTLDGQEGVPLEAHDIVHVARAVAPLRIVRSRQRHYFELLRTKLQWGDQP
jgi:NAD+ kinase